MNRAVPATEGAGVGDRETVDEGDDLAGSVGRLHRRCRPAHVCSQVAGMQHDGDDAVLAQRAASLTVIMLSAAFDTA